MRRMIVMFSVAFLMCERTWAQREPLVPMQAVKQGSRLTGKTRITYLLRQIDLTEEQEKHAKTLFETVLGPQGGNKDLPLEEIYTLIEEAQQAREKGDVEREKEISAQIRQLGQNLLGDEEFFMNMEIVLTKKQKTLLATARARLERNPNGALRPVDVFRAAEALDLTKQQVKLLGKILHGASGALRQARTLKPEVTYQLINELLYGINASLSAKQSERFNIAIARLRPDLATGLKIRVPDAQSGVKGANQGAAGQQRKGPAGKHEGKPVGERQDPTEREKKEPSEE